MPPLTEILSHMQVVHFLYKVVFMSDLSITLFFKLKCNIFVHLVVGWFGFSKNFSCKKKRFSSPVTSVYNHHEITHDCLFSNND